jgi:type IV secretory pathway protease TraF
LPGETIQLTTEGLKIDGEIVSPPSELKDRFSSFKKRASHKFGVEPFRIPGDSVFLIGDNAELDVMDSRVHGPVPVGNLEARVLDVC